jgi:hypothetical protein
LNISKIKKSEMSIEKVKKLILLISPYHTGSHKNWCEGIIKNSFHNVQLLSLTGLIKLIFKGTNL